MSDFDEVMDLIKNLPFAADTPTNHCKYIIVLILVIS